MGLDKGPETRAFGAGGGGTPPADVLRDVVLAGPQGHPYCSMISWASIAHIPPEAPAPVPDTCT
jgi:hypothetical protein